MTAPMTTQFHRAIGTVVAACVTSLATLGAAAQDYPSRPIKLINGFAAGGNVDVVGRLVGQKMSEGLGQGVIVENKPGAGTNIANAYVAAAEPDGYTLLLVSGAFPTVVATAKQVSFDPVDGFAWLSTVISYPLAVTVPNASAYRTLADLIADAKARPTVLNYPSPGTGSAIHLAVELFGSIAGVQMTHVPFRGSNEAMVQLIAGRMDVAFDTLTFSVEHVKSGALRPLAVTSRNRSKALPDVPSVAETLPEYEAGSFVGLAAPRGTPKPVVDKLNAELRRVVALPDIRSKFEDVGGTPWATSPDEMRSFVRAEIDKWKSVVKTRGIQAN